MGALLRPVARPRAGVRVLLVPTHPGPVPGNMKTPLQRKRAGFWYNADRNRRIAILGEAFKDRDVGALLREVSTSATLFRSPS